MADVYEEALLEKQNYHEGCPGCKVEQMKKLRRGYPYLELSFVWIVVLSTSLPISSLYPFLYHMIEDFGVATTEKDIGFYAGFVGCSFMFGRALTSLFWGIVADRYGRKPIILLGTISIAVFNALFGLSVNFWMAIATRFLLGTFNCLLGTMKAYASEIFREEYQATAMSAVSTAWGIGLIVGPALGGFLAQPADKYPSLFSKDSIFGRFRYALPCFTISAFALVVTVLCCFIPETLHNHEQDNTSHDDSYEILEAASRDSTASTANEGRNERKASLLKNWPLMSSIIVYCVLCLHDTAYSEIFALWANSPRKYGGLSYSTNDVGTVLAISGLGLFSFQVFVYPLAERLLGPVLVTRFAGALMIPVQMSYPFIAEQSGLSLSILLNCVSILVNVLSYDVASYRYACVRAVKKTCGEAPCGFSDAKTISRDTAERAASMRKLLVAVVLCGSFITVEVVGGIKASSLAILTDAAHKFSDIAAFAISFVLSLGFRLGDNPGFLLASHSTNPLLDFTTAAATKATSCYLRSRPSYSPFRFLFILWPRDC